MPSATPEYNKDNLTVIVDAKKMLDASNFTGAIEVLLQAVENNSTNADVYNLLGYSMRSKSDPDYAAALEYYNMAIELDSEHCGVMEYLGELHLAMGNLSMAEETLANLKAIPRCVGGEEITLLEEDVASYKKQKSEYENLNNSPNGSTTTTSTFGWVVAGVLGSIVASVM